MISDDFLFLLNLQDSPLFSLLVQATSLPCYQVDLTSYQGILGYVSTHYPASLLLAGDSAPQLLLKVLRCAAGLQHSANEVPNTVRKRSAASFKSQITGLLMSLLDFSRTLTLTSPRCDYFVGRGNTQTQHLHVQELLVVTSCVHVGLNNLVFFPGSLVLSQYIYPRGDDECFSFKLVGLYNKQNQSVMPHYSFCYYVILKNSL